VDLQPGSRFDRYVIEALLGQGGMGRVYRARDEKLQRAVALKLLRLDDHPDRATPDDGAERLLREARAAAGLEHANTIAIHDVGEFDGTPFIAMELVEGVSLRAMVGDASVSIETCVRYLVDVARALAAAHEHGIIHRDIKPENVIVRRDGVVKVLDFGIARPLHAPHDDLGSWSTVVAKQTTESWAKESGLVGTPRYMAPEQLRGEKLDARADQFSWGVMAYELLTGRSPWPDATQVSLTLVLAIVDDAAVDAAPLLDACPGQAADVVLRTLAKARADRFPSMTAVVQALAGAPPTASIPGAVADAAPQSTTGSTTQVRKRRRSPWIAWIAAVVALAAVGGVVARERGARPGAAAVLPPPAPAVPAPSVFALHVANPRRLTVDDGCEEFPSFTPDGTSIVYSAEAGSDEHVQVQSLADGTVRALTRGTGWDLSPTVSPDGKLVAFLHSDDRELATYVVDFDGHAAPRRIAEGGTRPSFSPDGQAVWAGNKRHPTRYDLATGSVTRTLESPANTGGPYPRELGDGRVVVAYPATNLSGESGIALFAPTGTMSWLARADAEEVLAFTPDGQHVLGAQTTHANNPELFEVPLAGGALTPLPSTDLKPSKGLVFSPDGARLAWSSCRGVWSLVRFDGKKAFVPAGSTSWQESSVAPVAGTPSIAVISERSGVASLWLLDPAGRAPARMVLSGGEPRINDNVDVSPDGKLAALELVGVGLAIVRLDDAAVRPLTKDPSDERPLFTHDGRQLVFTRRVAGAALQVHVVDVESGEARPLLDPFTKEAAPSPVDDRIAYISGDTPSTFVPMIADLATGRKRPLSPKLGPGRYMSTAFSRDGKRVAVVAGESRLVEVDAATGAVLRQGEADNMLQAPRYVGDELWAARTSYRGNVWMADVKVDGPR
jgi:serine/threonine-protein kinase